MTGMIWVPYGHRIAVVSLIYGAPPNICIFHTDAMHNGDIYLFDMSTKSVRQLTHTPEADEWSARWSPNGELLVYNRLKDTDGDGFMNTDYDVSDLLIIHSDGSGEQNLTQGKYWAYSPSWSPDGSKILFADHKFGVMQLIIYDFQQLNFTAITDSGAYFHPIWGP